MRIRILKDSAISLLKKEKNLENYYVQSNIEVEDFELELGDQTKDPINAVILHKSLKKLLPIHARDEKMWTYLTHTIGYKYMKSSHHKN